MIHRPLFLLFIFFVCPFFLALVRLSSEIYEISFATFLIIIISFFSFALGFKIQRILNYNYFNTQKASGFTFIIASGSVSLLSTLIIIFSLILSYQFYLLGGLPMFLDDVDAARHSMGGGIQFISMVVKPLLTVAFTMIVFKSKCHSNAKVFSWYYLYIACFISSLLLLATGSRGHILFILLTPFLMYWICYGFSAKKLLIYVSLSFIFITYGRHIRQYLIFGDSYIDAISQSWAFGDYLIFLYPGYVTLTVNYSVFERLVQTFLIEGHQFHYGYNMALPIISFLIPGRQKDLGDFQNELWQTGFDYNLTSTLIGIPFADFGPLGCFIFMIVFGYLTSIVQNLMYFKLSPQYVYLYTVFLSYIFFSFYSYPMTGLHSYVYPLISFVLFRRFIRRIG